MEDVNLTAGNQAHVPQTCKAIGTMTTLSDEALLMHIGRERDREAFHALFGRLGPKAFALAHYLTGSSEKAEDALQDAMLAVWQDACRFEPSRGKAKAWILRIVANKAIQSARKERSERKRQMTLRQEVAIEDEHAQKTAHEHEALLAAVRETFADLPEHFRQVLTLYFAAEMSQEDISEALAIPQSTICVRIRQGIEELRRRLSSAGYAAALPLLSTNNFGDMLLAGSMGSIAANARLLAQLDKATEGSRRAAAIANRTPWTLISLGFGAMFAGVFIYAVFFQSSGVKRNGTLQGDIANVRLANPRNKKWLFNHGMPDDLTVLEGKWEIRNGSIPAENMLCLPETLEPGLIALPVHIGRDPFVVTVEEVLVDAGTTTHTLAFTDNRFVLEGESWARPSRAVTLPNKNAPFTITVQYWRVGHYLIGKSGDHVYFVEKFNEYLPEGSRLLLAGYKVAIKTVAFRDLRDDEIPAQLRRPEQIVAALEKEGVQAVPGGTTPLLDRHIRLLAPTGPKD